MLDKLLLMQYNINMKNKNILYTLIAIIIIALGAYFFNQSNIQADITKNKDGSANLSNNKTVNFGAVLALTGAAVNEGTELKNGIEMAKADLLKDGITMNVEYYDDATDPKKSIAGVEYMNSKGYKTIFGPTWSYMITAALPKISEHGMTAYIGDTSSDVVDGDAKQKSNLVHGISPIYQIIDPSAAWIKDRGIKRLAILTVDGTWGIAHTNAWIKAAQQAGAEVVMQEKMDYTSEPTTIATLTVKAKSLKVDGIVQTGTEAGAIALVKKMQELKYNVPVLGTVYLKVAVNTKKINKGDLDLSLIENKSSEEFKNKYKEMYKTNPSAVAEPAYDLAMIAAHTELEKGKRSTQEYLLSKEHSGFASKYKFDASGDVINHGWIVNPIK